MFSVNQISYDSYLDIIEQVKLENNLDDISDMMDDNIIIEKLEQESIIIGLVGIEDSIKPKLVNCLKEFKKAKI